MTEQKLLRAGLQTPIGHMSIIYDEQNRLCAIDWEEFEARLVTILDRQYGAGEGSYSVTAVPAPAFILDALSAYFEGDITAIDVLDVSIRGTDFQQSVWQALRTIPAGQTCSYGELAVQINRPKAVRAVGLANGSNPVSIVVPCHRVIGASGKLTGYGGGLHRKRWLLAHEQGQTQFGADDV